MRKLIPWCMALCMTAPFAGAALSAPDGYNHIYSKDQEFEFEGHDVVVPFDIWVKPRLEAGAAFFDLWAEANLAGVQERAPDIMAASNSYDRCGDNTTVSNVTLVPQVPQAELCASVHYVKYQCIFALVPILNGLTVSMQQQETARTALVEQSANVCADLWAEVEDEGRSVKLEGNVTQTNVSGNSGLLGILIDTRGQFRSRLRSEINGALSDLRLLVPEALQPFDPVVETAEFTEREDGVLGLDMTMTVAVTAEDVPVLLQMLLGGAEEEDGEEEQ